MSFGASRSGANADTPDEAELARSYGAQGIGLCRTEHMFPRGRPPAHRAGNDPGRNRGRASPRFGPAVAHPARGLHRHPARYARPTGHHSSTRSARCTNSLSGVEDELTSLEQQGAPESEVALARRKVSRAAELHEVNPMLGLRGCRLGLVYPEVYEMQVRAIVEAALQLKAEAVHVLPEIMIPLIGHISELTTIETRLRATAEHVQQRAGDRIEFKFGTMLEVPRACLTATEIAGVAEFFSFGTNDLTQTTFGISRDDAEGRFLLKYVEGRHPDRQPVWRARPGRRRRTHAHRHRAGPCRPSRYRSRNLRRAWRRPLLHRLLRVAGAGLRQRVPRSECPWPASPLRTRAWSRASATGSSSRGLHRAAKWLIAS